MTHDKPEDKGANHELTDARAGMLFRALLKQTQDQVYFKDRQSRFVRVSDVMASKFKVASVEDLYGKSDYDYFTREHAQQTFKEEQELMSKNRQLINYVEKETWPDGRVTYVNSTKIPLRLDSGEIVGLMGITRDITEQVKAQLELEESRELLRAKNEIMEKDLQNARAVQRKAIPGPTPSVPFAEVAVSMTSLNEVSGDLVTFPLQTDTRLSFFLGDISGHGVSAGLFTMLAKHLADFHMNKDPCNPDETLRELDVHLEGLIPEGFLAAMAGTLYQENDDSYQLALANSCQPPLLWYKAETADVQIVEIPSQGALGLGICESFDRTTLPVKSGDCLLFTSDGATELVNSNGVQLETSGLAAAFQKCGTKPVREITQYLLDHLETHAEKNFPQDDTTLLVIRLASRA
ncbi:SpoIIE family protein phosphatase [Pelagicoccus sp. SDUM812005]|uniref:SpoIIE family protein phosphatase n=1 Tax=Pelagicoccus sp. SDUM812005 TaxID=3041257 RepID=UPI00280E4889|nr:SpoIIE family protein phosphatase [Pelagicoccus sp. SDUM812005]MDQ8182935.1 SpoIIE family protein phosphatase [Pelagicoccus sp. SDUM812005]